MLNITLGTAGHIDHGKTALVKSLTGCETDRLKEEKERGMSIDLGYAPCRIADLEVGIVDVPGHEDFIKTMVAGACGMDGVILVVAADDGIMPQTREHLDILTLLGLRQGVVALTKIDRVDARAPRSRCRPTWPGCSAARFSKARRSCRCRTSPAKDFDPFLEALQNAGAGHRAEADRRRLPPAAGSGILGKGLRDRRGGHSHRRVRPAGRRSRPAAARHHQPRQADRGLRPDRATPSWPASAPRSTWAIATPAKSAAATCSRCPAISRPQEFYLCRLAAAAPRKAPAAERRPGEIPHRHLGSQRDLLSAGGRRSAAAARSVSCNCAPSGRSWPGPGDPFILRTFAPVQTVGGGTILEATERRLKRNAARRDRGPAAAGRGRRRRRPVRGLCPPHGRGPRPSPRPTWPGRTKILRARLKEILGRLAARARSARPGHGTLPAPRRGRRGRQDAAWPNWPSIHRDAPESPGMTPEQLRQACPWPKGGVGGGRGLPEGRRPRRRSSNGRLALAEHRPTVPGPGRPRPGSGRNALPAAVVPSARRGRAGREACRCRRRRSIGCCASCRSSSD